MIGQIFGDRYEVKQQLGKKAGRRTLLAQDQNTNELVVIKLLSFGSDFEWDDLKLFEREAETLKSLSHPSIPGYLDYFEVNSLSSKGFALVQTYINANTLEHHLKNGRTFTEAEVKQIASLLLEILIYLHEQKPPVIHRDIKPSNILLSNRSGNSVGELYLIDFGSVQTVVAQEGGTMTVVGTYGYMPPEQFGGRTVCATDLYSLGTTLIYLVTGIHPADLPQKDLRIQFEQATNLTPALTNWLKRMCEPSLERRFSSAHLAMTQLEKLHSKNADSLYISKPTGSKIKLTQDENVWEIIIPPIGYHPSMISTILFAVAWNSFISFWTINAIAIPFPANIPFALFSLPFWGAGLQMISSVLFPLFKHSRLRLDKQQITFTWEVLGFKFHRAASASIQNITKLVYHPRTFTTDSDGNRVEIPSQLVIWAGVHKYQLGGTDGVIYSEPELEWLAHELGNWLGLPITRE
ncbi:serine/threonine protein kinase [Iningainema tapete]|uniref:Serine/threonine protein kinase n=1 Tax=Iningainema tapete BLCC-T55 TaxID=2748662 RepID=A0A8J6XC95_9CYAN|nr:serine/threonine-protein kinase [Iningainema tapete]MBD2772835.1 serine/threonine protein kinase [Iningainema tapete BLCC-T55]